MRFIAVVYFLFLPTFLLASSFEEGFKAHQNREYQKAHQIWLEQAQKGDVTSQYALAGLYHGGIGGYYSLKKAAYWYQEAAKQGHAASQVTLGDIVKFEYPKKALECYRKAAKNGDPTGMYNIGLMYEKGLAVDRDINQAILWYQKAEQQVKKNPNDPVNKDFGPLDKVHSLTLNLQYLERAQQGDSFARFRLVSFYIAVGDKEEAYHWISLMAENGDKNAQYHFAQYYNRGVIMAHDYQKALMWYRRSVAQGQKYAKQDLGKLEAFFELKNKANQDKKPSDEYKVGMQYFLWYDYKRAFKMFQKSANQGFKEGLFWLGILYRDGEGIAKDYQKAKSLFQKAVTQGKKEAKGGIRYINQLIIEKKVKNEIECNF